MTMLPQRLTGPLATLAALAFAVPAAQAATTSTDTVFVFANAPTAYEAGAIPGQFTIRRTGSTGPLTVYYLIGGSGVPGAAASPPATLNPNDYVTLTGSVVFINGQDTATITVTPFNDDQPEGADTVDLTLTYDPAFVADPGNNPYIISSPSTARVYIADDDLTCTVGTPDFVANEIQQTTGGGALRDCAVFRAVFNVDPLNILAPAGALAMPLNANLSLRLSGTGTNINDYAIRYHLGQDYAPGSAPLYDYTRLGETTSLVVGPDDIDPDTFVFNSGYLNGRGSSFAGGAGTYFNGVAVTPGTSRTGVQAQIRLNDQFEFSGVTGVYTVQEIRDFSGAFVTSYNVTTGAVTGPGITSGNGPFLLYFDRGLTGSLDDIGVVSPMILATLDVQNRLTVTLPAGRPYKHVLVEIRPNDDSAAEGAEDVTLTLQGSADFAIIHPTTSSIQIRDNDAIANITLNGNAIEGTQNGLATVTLSQALPIAVNVPFAVSGSATMTTDYTATNASAGFGFVTIPAGATSAPISVVPVNDSTVETVETVVVTLLDSPNYALAGSSASSVNPSTTINIADGNVPIVVVPPPPTTGAGTTAGTTTGTSSAGTTTGGTTATVRPLPSNSGDDGCGIGSGLAAALAAVSLALLGRRRRG